VFASNDMLVLDELLRSWEDELASASSTLENEDPRELVCVGSIVGGCNFELIDSHLVDSKCGRVLASSAFSSCRGIADS
jgi:hypothetical protein